jgi:hypothetical protein
MIAKFPNFSKLDLDSLAEIREFTALMPSYTEFNFTNMFVWDVMQPIMLSQLNDNLIVKFIDVHTTESYYSLIGTNKIKETIHALFELSLSEGNVPVLQTVPQLVIEHLEEDKDIEVTEDDLNHDYILSVPELSEFESQKFSRKRTMVKQFQTEHPSHRVIELDLSDPNSVALIREVLQKWETKLGLDAQEIIIEFTAIEKAMQHSKQLDIKCFATFVDNVIEAFTLFEHVDKKNVIMHFEKANRKISGIYEHQKHHLAKHLASQGIETINYGQDLGYEGLRRAKMSYHPIRFHKKYTIKHKKHNNEVNTYTTVRTTNSTQHASNLHKSSSNITTHK